jgi:3-oxoacyl-[acyl-carrier protein] reductase
MSELSGQTLLVTGAASGMGQATAIMAAAQGASVVLGDVNEAGLRKTEGEIAAAGGAALTLAGDVRETAWSEEAVRLANERFGSLTGLVCAAGIGTRHMAVDVPRDDWDRVLGVNLTGTFLCMQAAVRSMLEHKTAGAVVTFASEVAFKGYVTGAHYAASKAGIVALTKTFAAEYSRHGIRFNTVAPGLVDTPMLAGAVGPESQQEWAATAAMRRIGQPDDVASVVCFLLSGASGWITGQTLHVNGGHLMP